MNYSKENNSRNTQKKNKNVKRIRNKGLIIFFRVLLAVVLIGGFALCGAVLGAYIGIIESAETIRIEEVRPEKFSTKLVYASTGEEYDTFRADENREYATFDKIPQNLKDAYVAIEDERFYKHNGVDLKGIARAAYVTITSDDSEGASTITQQLIKNTVTNVMRNTLITKLQEQFLAVKYEAAVVEVTKSKEKAKDYILEQYMNTIGLHYNINGVQTGAHYYFNKDVSELNLTECAVLAAITNRPATYEPVNHAENNKKRATLILDNMLTQGYITDDEYNTSYADLGENGVYSRITGEMIQERNSRIHSWYADAVFEQVVLDLQKQKGYTEPTAIKEISNAGYIIQIPLDPKQQAIVDEVMMDDSFFPAEGYRIDVEYRISFKNKLTDKETHKSFKGTVYSQEEVDEFVKSKQNEILGPNDEITAEKVYDIPQPQASFVVMDQETGYVTAVSGGRGEKKTSLSFNRATQAKRSPGSVFKVLASFAPALDMGKITAATPIDDRPYTYGTGSDPYSPRNHWGDQYRGLTTIRDAIKTSANVVTVQNMFQTGVDACFSYLLNFGFTTLVDQMNENGQTDRVLSTALGGLTFGIYNSEVTAAYASIANHGNLNRAKFYTKVIDREGNVVLDTTTEQPKQVIKPGNAYILTDMMRDVLTPEGTGIAAKFQNSEMPISGKTGTTSDNKDLYFVGYTPYYTAGIWFGYDDNKEMFLNNQRYHLVIWRTIMERIHEGMEVVEFEKPDNIIEVEVCKDSGMLPTDLCASDPRGGRVITELFVSGTQPTEYCDVHSALTVCTVSGMRPTEFCPTTTIGTKVGIVKKDPYNGTANIKDRAYEIHLGGYCNVHTAARSTPIENPTQTQNPDPNAAGVNNNNSNNNNNNNSNNNNNQPFNNNNNDNHQIPTTNIIPEPPPDDIIIFPDDSGSEVPFVDDFISP